MELTADSQQAMDRDRRPPRGAGPMTAGVNWREVAACRDADPDLFFPVGAAGPALRQIEEAKRICGLCPARVRCLSWALDHGVDSGVWGGTTENERGRIRRAGHQARR